MVWVCDCVDNPVTAKFLNDVTRDLICNKCGSKLHEKAQLSLNEFIRLKNYKELFDDDYIEVQNRKVFEAFKIKQPCSDQEVADYLGIKRSSVNGRRNDLIKDFNIPLIVPYLKGIDKDSKHTVTLWRINKVLDVDRELELKVSL